jgi:hypothetical protein
MRKTGIACLAAALVAGCGGPYLDYSGSGAPTPSASTTSTVTTTELSLAQAPAATQTFYWGTVNLSVPGFAVPPSDMLTVSVDASGGLRYVSFQKFLIVDKAFGDAPDEFPLTGTKHVANGGNGGDGDVTVLDNPAPTGDHFLLSYHVVNTDSEDDYIESTEGTLAPVGWTITYWMTGTVEGAAIDANANGTVYPGDPNAPTPVAGQPATWSAPVELTAPGFVGPPVDHLTVTTDGQGQIQSLSYQKFPVSPHTFGGSGNFPLSGTGQESGRTVTVDMSAPPSPDHFMLRYHVVGEFDDYEEGIDGTRAGNGLIVRYFIQGSLEGATIDAHAAGTLVPASP